MTSSMKAAPLSPPRIKSRHESSSETADALPWLSTPSAPLTLAFAKQGQLLLWLASTAIYGNQSPGVPTTEKTLNRVASLTKSISGDHLSTGVARKISLDRNLIGSESANVQRGVMNEIALSFEESVHTIGEVAGNLSHP